MILSPLVFPGRTICTPSDSRFCGVDAMGQGGDVLAPIRFAKNVEVPGREFVKLQNNLKSKLVIYTIDISKYNYMVRKTRQ